MWINCVFSLGSLCESRVGLFPIWSQKKEEFPLTKLVGTEIDSLASLSIPYLPIIPTHGAIRPRNNALLTGVKHISNEGSLFRPVHPHPFCPQFKNKQNILSPYLPTPSPNIVFLTQTSFGHDLKNASKLITLPTFFDSFRKSEEKGFKHIGRV